MNIFYPFPTLREKPPLVAETQVLDGLEPSVDMLAARRSIDLSNLSAGWRRATFRLRLDLPAVDLGAQVEAIRVTLSLNCSATNLRFGVPMQPAARLGSYVADLEIEAGALARRASLRAVVTATIDGQPNRYLAESEVWNVWVSAPEVPLFSGDLDVKWADFTGDERPAGIDAVFKDQAHYVDITADPPVIYLNDGVQDLRRLFDESPRRNPAERALRDAYFHSIASSGWLAMFNASLGAISFDEDGQGSWPGVEWQRQVLLMLLPRIYPDLSTEDSLKRAFEDDSDQGGARLLQARANAAINGMLRETQKLKSAIRLLMEDAS